MISFVATGDSLIIDRLPKGRGINSIKEYISKADVRFTNLETVIIDEDCFANTFCGGAYVWSPSYVLDELQELGFNLYSWANNHTMDFSYNGLYSTIKNLKDRNMVFAGAGSSLYEASMPAFLNTQGGRVALLAQAALYKSQHGARAGDPHDAFPARPGLNILRYNVEYIVTEEQMNMLREVVTKTDMDADDALGVAQGFVQPPPDDLLDFYGVKLRLGNSNRRISYPDKGDMVRMERHIKAALTNSDYAIVSIHSHQMKGRNENEPDFFLEEYAHRCIDAGASAVIGSGTHLLRGVEIYKNRPIFYSLGNFIFQSRFATRIPADIVESRGYNPEHYGAEALFLHSKSPSGALGKNSIYFRSVIPYWEMDNGKLTKLILLPIKLGFSDSLYNFNGCPQPAEPSLIYDELVVAGKSYGTEYEIKDNIIEVKI